MYTVAVPVLVRSCQSSGSPPLDSASLITIVVGGAASVVLVVEVLVVVVVVSAGGPGCGKQPATTTTLRARPARAAESRRRGWIDMCRVPFCRPATVQALE